MFDSRQFLPEAIVARLTETRISDPGYALHVAKARTQRERLTFDGKLNILAGDHPARRVTSAGGSRLGMADRGDYLARIARVLMSDVVDGVMATMDVLEDLLSIDGFVREAGGASLLDGKLLIASLNRGGLAGTSWELDDPITGPSPAVCADWRLDGAKILLRVGDEDAGSLRTMVASARSIDECNAHGIPMFLEPLPVKRGDSGWSVVKTKEALAQLAGVASALGASSRYLWLKLPYCDGFETVARSTTLPILLLGGESAGDAAPFLRELASGLAAGANVRGAMVGRNILYPGADDPLAAAAAAGGIIHRGWTVDQALVEGARLRGMNLNLFQRGD
jgi:hypothetical protein